ncbi:RNA-directed DNA polymerase [Aliicoccus persicus]|uniref:Reverse transcriptase (RNA-dependent DNA polymerase) n=1 Tax=Aliicoccus persicus TaxID=930138 RepID=A0A662Z524_9STAP|nr:RNA-directed DNA polymerase [Aliicoccus persicus]SEV97160.1 Reverse transcriptase (RNA-dependent DNA polymerase) [Aliicoccus persicus]
MSITKFLLKEGYFSDSLPPIFSSEELSLKESNINVSKDYLSKNGSNKRSKLINFSIPKNSSFRRTLSIVHPLHYIKFANLIDEQWENISKHFEKSSVSLTKIIKNNSKLEREHGFEAMRYKQIENLSLNRFILKIDINRYYPSIYTHSIPWALHGKKYSKLNISEENLGNNLDTLTRNMQDGQTIGIPIGPFSSDIIQEIIGTAIDEDFSKKMEYKVPGYRYTDDMEYYFKNLNEANNALSVMNNVLKNYELDLNSEKTVIEKIPMVLEKEWIRSLKNFRFNKNYSKKNVRKEKELLIEYFNSIFNFYQKYNDKGIGKYGLKVIRNYILYPENWKIFQSLMLKLSLIDSTVLPLVHEIIEAYHYKGFPINLDEYTKYVHLIIEENVGLRNDYEILWSLYGALNLGIKLNKDATLKLTKYENCLVCIMVLLLYDKDLLYGSPKFEEYKEFISNETLYDEYWLLKYECCTNGWLEQDSLSVSSDKFFNQLYHNEISFINLNRDSVKVKVINLLTGLYFKEDKESNKPIKEFLNDHSIELKEEIINKLEASIKITMIQKLENQDIEGKNSKVTEHRFKDVIYSSNIEDEWLNKFISSNSKQKYINVDVNDEYI